MFLHTTPDMSFKTTIERGMHYVSSMPLEEAVERRDLRGNIVCIVQEQQGTYTQCHPKKPLPINIQLIHYLIQLQYLLKSSELIEEQMEKLTNLQNALFILLATEKYYGLFIEVLTEDISQREISQLKEFERNEYLDILMRLQNQRAMNDLPSKEINQLCDVLDPREGHKPPSDVPPPLSEGDSLLAEALFKKMEKYYTDSDTDKPSRPQEEKTLPVKTITPHEQAESEVEIRLNFRENYQEMTEHFQAEDNQLRQANKKINKLHDIFFIYENQLKKSWISNGRAEKLQDNKVILDLIDVKHPISDLDDDRLQRIEDAINEKEQDLSNKRANCATFFADGVRNLCSRLGLWSAANKKAQPSNGQLAIEKAREVLDNRR